jgi:amidase
MEEIDPPLLDETTAIIQRIADTEMSYFLPAMLPRMSEKARIFIGLLLGDRKPDLDSYMTAIADRYRVALRWKKFMQQYPLILGPVSTLEPFEVGEDIAGPEAVKQFVESITLGSICTCTREIFILANSPLPTPEDTAAI